MNDYIRRKDVLAALNGLFQDIIDNHQIGNGKNDYKDGIFHGEKACVIEAALRIKKLPAEDVKPVVPGMWLTQEYRYGTEDHEDEWIERRAEKGDDVAYCSKCGASACLDGSEEYILSNFCPNCGADMRGELDE